MNITFSEFIAVVQTLLAIGAFVYAYQEFKQWRIELVGSKRIELALNLAKTVVRIQAKFERARHPLRSPGLTREEDFSERLAEIQKHLLELYEIRWDIKALLNKDIQNDVERYNEKFHTLQFAMEQVIKQEATKEDSKLVFGYRVNEVDEFQKEIDKITEDLSEFARQYL